MAGENRNREVGVLEVKVCHPIPWPQNIPEKMNSLHFEVEVNQPLVEFMQIYDGTLTAVCLVHQERVADEPSGMGKSLGNHYLGEKSSYLLGYHGGIQRGETNGPRGYRLEGSLIKFYPETPNCLENPGVPRNESPSLEKICQTAPCA